MAALQTIIVIFALFLTASSSFGERSHGKRAHEKTRLSRKRSREITMTTPKQFMVRNEGDALAIECAFKSETFNLFDNPVLWYKTQIDSKMPVNIQGTINEPFLRTERMKVSMASSPPGFRFVLSIQDLRVEDNGNYTCEVRGHRSTILASVTHRLVVKAPVTQMVLANKQNLPPTPTLKFQENQPSYLSCLSVGGHPEPEVTVMLGEVDLTARMRKNSTQVIVGEVGLKRISYNSERWTKGMLLTSADDGKSIDCIAAVPGLSESLTSARIEVQYAPKIYCDPVDAKQWEKNVILRCTVKARPQPYSLTWHMVGNNSKPLEVSHEKGYRVITQLTSDTSLYTMLRMPVVRKSHFGAYYITAKNSINDTRQLVVLSETKFEAPPVTHKPSKTSGRDKYKLVANGENSATITQCSILIIMLSTLSLFTDIAVT